MILKGTHFKVHWIGHELIYENRIYEVVSLIKNCDCPNPNNFVNGNLDISRDLHYHIVAKLIKVPNGEEWRLKEDNKHWFNGYLNSSLKNIENPDNDWLEIVGVKKGTQLELF